MRGMAKRICVIGMMAAIIGSLTGCSSIISKATGHLADHLTTAIMKENDPALVRDGAPTLMLLMDGIIEGNPHDAKALASAAQMYSSYTSAFVAGEDAERAKILADKAKSYAFRALSLSNKEFAKRHFLPYAEFEPVLATFKKEDVPALMLTVSVWATWIQAHSDDWNAIADMAKVQAMTKKLLELDDDFFYGSPHLYMAVLLTILPPAIGGHPKEGQYQFEESIKAAKGRFLPTYVLYAKQIAMPSMDRDLFNKLMKHIDDTPADIVPELTLVNTLAKKDAQKLKEQANTYFDPTE